MTTALDPIVSEFATAEQAASYDKWFKARVAASLADTRPCVPHDEAMARVDAVIEKNARSLAARATVSAPARPLKSAAARTKRASSTALQTA